MKEEVVVFVSYVEEKEEGKNKLLGGIDRKSVV